MRPSCSCSRCGRVLTAFLGFLLLPMWGGGGDALAGTRCVNPGGTGSCFSNINAAINAAVSGVDNVTIAAGTYHERVVLNNKKVNLTGAGAASTIINADDLGRPLTISGAAVTSGTVVSGLTLTNGTRSDKGGGILVETSAAPTIENCTISDNVLTASSGTELYGAGLHVENASAVIHNNLIQNNRAIHTPMAGGFGNLIGGGISVNHSDNTWIEGNQILGNALDGQSSPSGGYSGVEGAGIEVLGSSDVTIRGNRIESNALDGNYGGGGGISTVGSTSTAIEENTISENEASTASVSGGGIDVNNASATILRNRIVDNYGLGGRQIRAAWRVTVSVGWNLIAQTGSAAGKAVAADGLSDTANFDFYHNTVVKHGDGLVLKDITGGTISDNIIADILGDGIRVSGGFAATLRYNDLWDIGENYSGISPGTGDVSVDPRFVSPALADYHLLPRSPAIDAGDPSVFYSIACSDAEKRHCLQDGNFDGSARADLGSYEHSPAQVFASADFDGDGLSDKIAYRSNTWHVKKSDGTGNLSQAWGTGGDIPAPGNFGGSSLTDYVVWRPSTGTWHVKKSDGSGNSSQVWGTSGDVPVPGDYGGSSLVDYALWRPGNGTWYVKKSDGSGDLTQAWGTAGDIPVPGNFLGDAKTDYAVWRPGNGTWYVKKSAGAGADTLTQVFGTAGDVPLAADFDNDGVAEFAVFRPSNGKWYIRTDAGGTESVAWGVAGDVPLPSQMADDGRADKVLWRPSNATWYVKNAEGVDKPSVSWGLIQDIPAAR